MATSQRTVLVTGASSGIGRATASLLAERGYRVLAGVRSAQAHQEMAELPRGNVTPVRLDVTCPEQIDCVVEQLNQTSPDGLYALVNNAGVGPPSAVELTDLDELRRILEVNTLAPLRMIQACLPMLRHGQGRVINMSSMNGTIALPMVGAYSASKFALEALSDTLRMELRPWRIPVSVIRPGQVRTSIFAKAREALEQRSREIPAELANGYEKLYARAGEFNERGASSFTRPEAVARVVLKILRTRRPKARYVVGLDARGLQLASAICPTWLLERLIARTAGSNVIASEPSSAPALEPASDDVNEDLKSVAAAASLGK